MIQNTSGKNCRIALDAMGGDFAPENTVLGALAALDEFPSLEIYLVGQKEEITKILKSKKKSYNENLIINAKQVISMDDSPLSSIKSKSDSSIVVGINLLKEKKVDAFVSAGNTGAVSAASTLILGRINGVERPTIAAPLPNERDTYTFISDAGAFVDSKPSHLLGYAILANIFVKEIYKIEKPKIGLLNVGEELSKGYKSIIETGKLLKEADLNFIGNVEGKDVFKGKVDVVVCDGFVGNILLKFAESILPFLKTNFRNYAEKSLLNKLRVLFTRGTLKSALANVDYQKYGGIPLLGVNGISIIGHGSSSILAIKNMIIRAMEMHEIDIITKIQKALKDYGK